MSLVLAGQTSIHLHTEMQKFDSVGIVHIDNGKKKEHWST